MGTDWGRKGYGTVSLEYVQEFYYDTFVSRHARWGPSPYKMTAMEKARNSPEAFRRLWMVENPRDRGGLRGRKKTVRWERYATVSPTTGEHVTCLELRTGFGLRMGWTFLRHRQGRVRTTEITELYVWPVYRRVGFGSWLEEQAVEEAKYVGSEEIHLLMNEADSVLSVRGAARKFATARGYSIFWRETVAPRAKATCIKSIIPA
jgi:GNAT superfamily N-acetyltransferase